MIRDNYTDTVGIRQLNLRCSGNSVVAGDDHADAVRPRLLDQMLIQPVAVMNPVRNRRVRFRADQLQALRQNVGRTDAVHIVIPDDTDMAALRHRFQNQLHRLVHVLQQPRRITVLQGSPEKFPDLRLLRQLPVAQNTRQHRADPELLRPLIKIRSLCGDIPFLHPYSPMP